MCFSITGHSQSSSSAQITPTFPDTISVNDTLVFETLSVLRDNGRSPHFCSPLYNQTDSIKGQTLFLI